MIIDECHRVPATTFKNIVDISKARYKIGLSGTLRRKDHKHVLIFDYISKKVYKPAVENTMNPEIVVVKTGFKLKTGNNVPWATKMNILSSNPNYKDFVTDMARIQAEKGHKVLVVSDRVEFLETCADVMDNFQCIAGATTKDKVDLVNYDGIFGSGKIFSEGINEPPLSSLIMAYPINNRAVLEQLIGRIERPFEGKMQPEAIDIALEGRTAKTQLAQRINYYTDKGYKIRYVG